MSKQFDECLRIAVEAEEISADEAAYLREEFDRFRGAAAAGGETTADAEAKRQLSELLKAESEHKKRQAALGIRAIKRIARDIPAFVDAGGEADIAGGALALLEHFGTAPYSSVAGRQKAILGQAHAKMEEALHHFRRGAFGGDWTRWNAARLPNVVREAFGEDTGDMAAKQLAKVWEETHEWLRSRFNKAGGAIGKLENWGMPQRHDRAALVNAGRAAWKDAIRPRLDLARMRHPLTGGKIGSGELERILDGVYDNIVTDGWIDRQPSRQAFGRGALANQRAEHRFLIFRSADEWLAYQKDFGAPDPFAAMMGHISMMANDIGAMEVLGPNPAGTVEWLKQAVTREAELKAAGKPARFAGTGDARDRASKTVLRIGAVWDSISGTLNTPVDTKLANRFGLARTALTGGMLGQAALSAVSDVGFSIMARSFAGMPAATVATDLIRSFAPATRREAVEAGLILDSAAQVFQQQARYAGTLQGPEWANWIADRVLTVSGLTPWTQAGRHAFGMAMQVEFGKRTDLAFGDLPDALRGTLGRYGIDPKQWELIRKASLHRKDGAAMLRPAEIARVDENLAERYLEMVLMETEYAVPSGSHRTRSFMRFGTRSGTWGGELIRSAGQFKGFGAAVLFLHGARVHRMIAQRQTFMAGVAYAGSLLFTTTLISALAMQLKQTVNGRDPRPMDNAAFWGAAVLQGGGLGLWGDFLFSDLNRYGGGWGD
ncbi:MAG: hypothetical protein KF723_22915, partial [Rhizobiaceae bacterium]|nr:hypothetical protein [Rhizobiaceae bacterium]